MTDLLPFRPRPEPGELLTSWLARLALENGTTVARIIASCVRDTHYPVLDLDQHLPRPLLHRLAERTGLPWPAIERTSLRALHDLYVGRRQDHGAYRWFMSVRPVRQRYTMHGQQVCPDCLATDPVPHYRQTWRLSFVTTCPVHECLRLDRCPACDAPIDHRGACDGRDEVFDEHALCRCGGCGADFRAYAWHTLGGDVTLQARREAWGYEAAQEGEREKRVPREIRLRSVVNWQARLTAPPKDGRIKLGGVFVEIESYLRGCRHLLRVIGSEPLGEDFRRLVYLRSGLPLQPVTAVGKLQFDRSEIGVRHANLAMVSWLLSDWPITFQELCFEW